MTPVDRQPDRAIEEPQEQTDKCPWCSGDGWYVGHEDECYETGDCQCSGVQIQCECSP